MAYTKVNPKAYTNTSLKQFPVSGEMGKKAVSNDFPDLLGYIHIENVARTTPGKTLDFDFVISQVNSGTFYQASLSCSVYMDFHYITDPESTFSRTVKIGTWNIKNSTYSAEQAWNNSPKPRYGWRAKKGGSTINPYSVLSSSDKSRLGSMSYSAMNSMLINDYGLQLVNTDGTAGGTHVSGTKTFPNFEPFGRRYLSNKGKWASNSDHMKATVSGNYALMTSCPETKLDSGLPGTLIRIDQESFVGEDRYRIRVKIGKKEWTWYNNKADDTYGVNNIDNALLGIPDYQSDQQKRENWPPRYDARFYKVESSGWKEKPATGQYKKSDGWAIF